MFVTVIICNQLSTLTTLIPYYMLHLPLILYTECRAYDMTMLTTLLTARKPLLSDPCAMQLQNPILRLCFENPFLLAIMPKSHRILQH